MNDRQNIVAAYLRAAYDMLKTVLYRGMEERLGIMDLLSTMLFEMTGSRPQIMLFADDRADWMTHPQDVDKLIAVLEKVQARISKLFMFAEHQELRDLAERLYRINIMLRILREDEDIPEAGRDGLISYAEGSRLLNPRNLPLADEDAHARAEQEAEELDHRSFEPLAREVDIVEEAAREWLDQNGGDFGEPDDGEDESDDDDDDRDVWAPDRTRRRLQ